MRFLLCAALLCCLAMLASSRSLSADGGAACRTVFEDDFTADDHHWERFGGDWKVDGGLMVGTETRGENAITVPTAAPVTDTQTIEATVLVRDRKLESGWSLAGITLLHTPDSLWVLSLTEDQRGQRYIDFVEGLRGAWQAQSAGSTRLQAAEMHKGGSWLHGRSYRLRLSLDRGGVSALVRDMETGEELLRGRYLFGSADAVRSGAGGLFVRGVEAAFDKVSIQTPAVERGVQIAVKRGRQGAIAVLQDSLPGEPVTSIGSLLEDLERAGYGINPVSAQQVTDPGLLDPTSFFLFIIPNAGVYPADGVPALASYLRRGGHLMLLGGPAFTRPVWRLDGRWVDKEGIQRLLSARKPQHIAFSFDTDADLRDWSRATNARDIPAGIDADAPGASGRGKALHAWMDDMTGWTTFASPTTRGLFPSGHTLLAFWARGDAKTPQLSIEVNEEDGSRWIAVVRLATEWKHYVLTPSDFLYWPDSRTGKRRGGSADQVKPQSVQRVVFGLAHSHTGRVGPGPHEFWVDQVGTMPHPLPELNPTPMQDLPAIETVTPVYKVYATANIAELRPVGGTSLTTSVTRFPEPLSGVAPQVRTQGRGFGHGFQWRWIPLLESVDAGGVSRGAGLWMLVTRTFPFRRNGFICMGIEPGPALQQRTVRDCLVHAVDRLREGAFLFEAGADQFALWPGEDAVLGADVVNIGFRDVEVAVRSRVTLDDTQPPLGQLEARLQVAPGHSRTARRGWQAPDKPGQVLRVTTELTVGDRVIDAIDHEVQVVSPAPAPRDKFIAVRGNDFMLGGEPWYPVGVNFWTLYVSGLEPGKYGMGWLDPHLYDPVEVEKDLQRLTDLGINMVSIQLGRLECARNLVDFLARCQRHGVHVWGYIDGASPVGFDENTVRSYLQAARLTGNPNLFGYDIIWEPGNWMFRGAGRNRWDRDWERWITDRYGSIAEAEKDWGFAAPRTEGRVTSPSDRQLREDGPWRVMVAAYRRFMDNLMSRKWNDAVRRLRRLDPNHLISFRQGNTLPQDFTFTATAKHVDFMCPEGYAISLSEEGYNASGFITRFVHFTTRGKPILWAEFGKSTWDADSMSPSSAGIDYQRRYHEQFYKMVLESGANGTCPWWWPGGYRVNERSDYGITNPDGSPRPSALLIKRFAPRIKAPRPYPAATEWLTMDREAHPGGYWHVVFHQGAQAYRKAREKGGMLGVRTAGTGTDSCTTPMIAVGDTPCTGRNPPKYLDAEFNYVAVLDAEGRWQEVANGGIVDVHRGQPIRLRVSVGNTQEATWLTPARAGSRPGAVYLVSTPESATEVRRPIPRDTRYLDDALFDEFTVGRGVTAETRLALRMEAQGRTVFGEVWRFRVRPK